MSSTPTSLNSTLSKSSTEPIDEEWSMLQLFLILIFVIITLITVVGNGLVIYLFAKSKRALRSPTHWLIASLAVADFSVGALVLPLLISVTFNDFKWYIGKFSCDVGQYVHFCLCATSLLSMMTISIERYLGVRFPLRHKRILTKKRVIKLIILTWLLGLSLTSIPLTIWPISKEEEETHCRVNLRSDFALFLSLSVFFIPLFVTCILYWQTYKQAVKLYVPQAASNKFANITSMNSNVSKSNATSMSASTQFSSNVRNLKSDKERYEEKKQQQTQLAKKLSITVGIMLTLYAPQFTVFLIAGIDPRLVNSTILLATAWVRYMSSCINPFVYIIVVPGYKKAFLKTVWNETSSLNNTKTTSASARRAKKQTRKKSFASTSSSSGMSSSRSVSEYPSTSETYTNEPSYVNVKKYGYYDDSRSQNSDSSFENEVHPQCSNCGISITDAMKGDTEMQICAICNIRYNSRLKSFTDVKHVKIVSRPSIEEVEPRGSPKVKHSNEDDNEDPYQTQSSVSSGSLVYELRSFLKDMEKLSDKNEEKNDIIFRDRAGQLLSSIVKIIPPDKEDNIEDNSYCKIDKLRRSLVRPISYRKSLILSTMNAPKAERVGDLEELKELDDILEKIEKELVAFERTSFNQTNSVSIA